MILEREPAAHPTNVATSAALLGVLNSPQGPLSAQDSQDSLLKESEGLKCFREPSSPLKVRRGGRPLKTSTSGRCGPGNGPHVTITRASADGIPQIAEETKASPRKRQRESRIKGGLQLD